MKAKHTPGPWTLGYGRSVKNQGIFNGGKVDAYGNQNVRLINGPTTRIARMEEAADWRPQETVEADAALILAAPDLAEALRSLLACPAMNEDESEPETDRARELACSALAKAGLEE